MVEHEAKPEVVLPEDILGGLSVDRSNPSPISLQLYRQLRGLIESEVLPVGMKLPTEQEMVAGLGVSRDTVRAVTRQLRVDGLIKVIHAKGTFVGHSVPTSEPEAMFSRKSVTQSPLNIESTDLEESLLKVLEQYPFRNPQVKKAFLDSVKSLVETFTALDQSFSVESRTFIDP